MTMYSGAWSAPNTADDNAKRNDYFGFAAGYQPTEDYFSPNVIYGFDISPSLAIESQLGYNNNTKLDNKNFLARVTLYGRSSFTSNTSLLYGPFIQYEDDTNPFRAGFSSIVQHRLDKEVAIWGGVSAVVKKETSVDVVPELTLGITWALSTSEPARTIISEPSPTLPPESLRNIDKQVTETLPQQPAATLPPEKASVEATHVFKVDSSYISNEKVLKESIQYLHQHPDMSVRIINKHSIGGTLDYNRWLGQRRVERLRVFYAENGIDVQRLKVSSSINDKLGQPLVQILYFETEKSKSL
ncbi:hypothetical protein VIA_001828 [Vibrio orientalis CIP 102891 = ATCC 33934]|nr:hypothetical protein VIA_001828 [Vibrio orientalis CIP 102891 = ATCC 33934]